MRFGRVPKKEKAKIMEQMKRVNAQSQMSALHSSLENDQEFLDKIIKAHYHNCDYTNEKVREMIDRAWLHPQFVNCPAHMVSSIVNFLMYMEISEISVSVEPGYFTDLGF